MITILREQNGMPQHDRLKALNDFFTPLIPLTLRPPCSTPVRKLICQT